MGKMVTGLKPSKVVEDGYLAETKLGGGRWLPGCIQVRRRKMGSCLKPDQEEEDSYMAESR
jgi:hypothetical protein